MIGLDTNILVRYFAQDDAKQSAIATEILENRLSDHNQGYVSTPVLVETAWTLQRVYKVAKVGLYVILEKLLTTSELSFEYRDEAWKALQLAKDENVDFADALIGSIHKAHGCTVTLTFDHGAAKIDLFELQA